ncbi:E3 ubiquitin-protein ligase RNF12-like [Telopea speciosissima]|uniref:E3 ubiquitin-protein ligase RNF12-like n=1 Tax=Telopea speciosissima TaxID=54955 RepID=UPI001CC4B762|nr:E3 ubiquitin-protein ligase RNF12-like [Telopea speciosissima]
MVPAEISSRRSIYTEFYPISPADANSSEFKLATFHFKVDRQYVLATTPDFDSGVSTILDQTTGTSTERSFNIEFSYLLIPQVSECHIHTMLTDLDIPPSSIDSLKEEISTYAFRKALRGRKKNSSGSLDFFICLDVNLIGFRRDIDEDFNLVSASQSWIEAVEIVRFEEEEEEEITCMICMEEYVRGVEIARLPCSHIFHSECIAKWLKHKNTCPFCRFAMPT